MKRNVYILVLGLLGCSLSGCAGYPNSGATIGGVLGGGVGAASGAALCGYNPACMVAGGIVGAIAGGMVGNSVQATQTPPPPLGYGPVAGPPQPPYQPGLDPAADAAYNAGRARYWQQLSRQRQAAAYAAGVSGN